MNFALLNSNLTTPQIIASYLDLKVELAVPPAGSIPPCSKDILSLRIRYKIIRYKLIIFLLILSLLSSKFHLAARGKSGQKQNAFVLVFPWEEVCFADYLPLELRSILASLSFCFLLFCVPKYEPF